VNPCPGGYVFIDFWQTDWYFSDGSSGIFVQPSPNNVILQRGFGGRTPYLEGPFLPQTSADVLTSGAQLGFAKLSTFLLTSLSITNNTKAIHIIKT
jgi:hypothetical protein